MIIFALETLSKNHKSALRVVLLYLDRQSPPKKLAEKLIYHEKKIHFFSYQLHDFLVDLWTISG